jgi:hypothetical protein
MCVRGHVCVLMVSSLPLFLRFFDWVLKFSNRELFPCFSFACIKSF